MPNEIERKFLVTSEAWRRGAVGTRIRQGYLSTRHGRSVRIRSDGESATITVKGRKVGRSAPEFEYLIPIEDARAMLEGLCVQPPIEKTRYRVEASDGHVWEVDEFHGANEGLVVAELELEDEAETFGRPDWLGVEVTDDERYLNFHLVERPYRAWEG